MSDVVLGMRKMVGKAAVISASSQHVQGLWCFFFFFLIGAHLKGFRELKYISLSILNRSQMCLQRNSPQWFAFCVMKGMWDKAELFFLTAFLLVGSK